MEKAKIIYKGAYQISLQCPGFHGIVNVGDEIAVEKKTALSMDGHDDWTLVVEKKTKKGVDE